MTPNRAIAILETPESLAIISLDTDLKEAVKLGIEALQRILHTRSFNHDWAIMPLPSETTY
jgi:hypothetical protein